MTRTIASFTLIRLSEAGAVMSGASADREWPEHFPPSCPPSDAANLDGNIFRFVRSNPIEPMKSWLEDGIGSGSNCRRAGLSASIDLEHLKELRLIAPIHKGKLIAQATLATKHGKLKQTGQDPNHYTLWLRSGYHPSAHLLFKVVA